MKINAALTDLFRTGGQLELISDDDFPLPLRHALIEELRVPMHFETRDEWHHRMRVLGTRTMHGHRKVVVDAMRYAPIVSLWRPLTTAEMSAIQKFY